MKRFYTILTLMLSIAFCTQAKVYYVSQDGSSNGKGTLKKPFKTINAASAVAMPGDTIMVMEGIYRERVTPQRGGEAGKPIVYMGEPGKMVMIKGSDVWNPQWKSLGNGIYVASPDEDMFDDNKADYEDGVNPFEVLLASTPYQRAGRQEKLRDFGGNMDLVYTCGQVFVNGEEYKEVPFAKELAEQKTWHYDSLSKGISMNFGDLDPTKQTVEITTRRRIFAPSERGLGHIVVQGFVMEHCGNQYPTNFWMTPKWAQRGAVGIEAGHNWVIRRNVIRYVKTFAIDAGMVDQNTPKTCVPTDNVIEDNYIIDNGSAGIMSNNSLRMIIRNNVVVRNNTLRFEGEKRWEHAGIKCHSFKNGLIEGNYVADNYMTDGIWLDNQFPNSRVTRNVLVNNEKKGLFLEMSDYNYDMLMVDNNIIVGNNRNQIYCHDASGATFMHNLIANGTSQSPEGQGIKIHQVSARTKSYHHTIYNNIFAGNSVIAEICYPSHRGGPQRLDCNVYNTNQYRPDFYIASTSDKPRPWGNEEFYKLVTGEIEVGEYAPRYQNDHKVRMNFDQWKSFWKAHGCDNDENSTLTRSLVVSYFPATYTLTITSWITPSKCLSKNHDQIDVDYFGNKIPQDGHAVPGPFQKLKRGENVFKVWSGLPVLGYSELPDFEIFNN